MPTDERTDMTNLIVAFRNLRTLLKRFHLSTPLRHIVGAEV